MQILSIHILHWRQAVLLVFFSTCSVFADTDSALIDFIVDEQSQNGLVLNDCSYQLSINGESRSNDLIVPINTLTKVVIKGKGLLITCEQNVVNEYEDGKREVSRQISRHVLNEDIFAEWLDSSKASITLYEMPDWKESKAARELGGLVQRRLGDDPRVLSMKVENGGTLQAAIASSRHEGSKWKWEVEETAPGSEESMNGYTLKRTLEGQPRPDLTVQVDPSKGYAVTESLFEPYNQVEQYKRICKKDYRQIGNAWILTRMENIVQVGNSPVPRERVITTVDNFKWLSDGEGATPSLASLQLPEQVLAKKIVPNQGGTSVADGLYLLQDGILTPVEDVPGALASVSN